MGSYRERRPPADLAGHLRCTWTAVTGRPAAVLPDGCLDLMWLGGRLVVAGPDTGPVPTALPVGTPIAAVRFRPGAAAAVLGVPAAELRDQRVPLADLWAAGAALERRVDDAADGPERVAVLAAAVRDRLADAPRPDPVALAVAAALGASDPATYDPATADLAGSNLATYDPATFNLVGSGSGRIASGPQGGRTGRPGGRTGPPGPPGRVGAPRGPIGAPAAGSGSRVAAGGPAIRPLRRDGVAVVTALAARAGLSERQLHRRCLAAFGYGAKTLDRVLRLQRFLALARARPAAGLADLAVAAGYADQAHLGHDCRALAGATPGELRPVSDPDKTPPARRS